MKGNLRRNTMDKEKRPQTSQINGNNSSSIEDFRLYINNLETLLRDTLNENVKLRQQLNEFSAKKNQLDIKKLQAKVDDLVKKYSKGKIFLNDLEKKIGLSKQLNVKEVNKNSISNDTNDSKLQNIIAQYESQLDEILEKKSQVENRLNSSEKEKDDLKNKFNDEFVL